ncbi:MAG: hypothetical protein WB507_14990 [Solirubrobacterales bacterium]
MSAEPDPSATYQQVQLRVRLLIKTLSPPLVDVDEMLVAMRRIYSGADILVEEGPREDLRIAAHDGHAWEDFRVGECRAGEVTDDQHALFQHRGGAQWGDIVIYIVRTVIPPMNGCAASPADLPGAIVSSRASRFTLAHEVGHVLGLAHVGDSRNLMTNRGTATIKGEPELTSKQIRTMHNSRFCIRRASS